MKAVWAERKEVSKYEKIRYNKDGTIVVTDDWRDGKHTYLPSIYKPNAVVDTLTRGGKQHDRTIYGQDARWKNRYMAETTEGPSTHHMVRMYTMLSGKMEGLWAGNETS